MQQSHITISTARAADVIGMQDVYYRAWLVTYPNEGVGITHDDVEDWFKDRFATHVLSAKREKLSRPQEEEATFVARCEGRVVGVCSVKRHINCNTLKTLYVHPEYQRLAIGTRLWLRALDYLNRRNSTIVDVASYNENAIAFYRRHGFKQLSSVTRISKFKFKSGALMPLITMVREPDLGPAPKYA